MQGRAPPLALAVVEHSYPHPSSARASASCCVALRLITAARFHGVTQAEETASGTGTISELLAQSQEVRCAPGKVRAPLRVRGGVCMTGGLAWGESMNGTGASGG